MVISVVERNGRAHSTAADKVDAHSSRQGDVSVVFSGAGKVLGTLALSRTEARALWLALRDATGDAPVPSSSDTDG